MISTRHSTAARTGISSVITTDDGFALTAPARLCFIVEERYENDVMPGAVVDVLRSWGHHVDVLRPHGMLADLWDLIPTASPRYDAFVLKTVSGGPGLSLLDAAGAVDLPTLNDHRAIRLARDKAVARADRPAAHPARGPDRHPTATTLTFAPVQEATA